MSRQRIDQNMFFGGISVSEKVQSPPNSFYFAENLDIFNEPTQVKLNPRTEKISGTTITNLVRWIVAGDPFDNLIYYYDRDGKLYSGDPLNTFTMIEAVPDSHGNGLEVLNGYLYYVRNTNVGRYGQLGGLPTFNDTWWTDIGGAALNDTSGFHSFAPIKAFRSGLAIGNQNQLSFWDGSVAVQDRLTLPPGLKINALEIVDEYLAIAAYEGDEFNKPQRAFVFFWDGDATNYNFFIKVEAGPVSAMINKNNQLFAVLAGGGKVMYLYPQVKDMHKVPFILRDEYIEIYPGSITSWHNIIHFGVASETNSSGVVEGIYQWGNTNDSFPEALNMGFTISSGETAGVLIGAVKAVSDDLYIAWKDSADNYGIDQVKFSNDVFATGYIKFLIFDDSKPTDEDMAIYLKALYKQISTGMSVQLGYSQNRDTFTLGTPDTTANSFIQKLPIDSNKNRFQEFQWEVLLTSNGSPNTPVLLGVGFKYDNLQEETKAT